MISHFSGNTSETRGFWSYYIDLSLALNKPAMLAFCLGRYGSSPSSHRDMK
jgi:hypothetical protein